MNRFSSGTFGAANRDVRDVGVNPARHLPRLLRRRHFGINRVIKCPEPGVRMHELQAEQILALGKIALVREPEIFVHAAQNQIRLGLVRRRVLAQNFCDARGHGVRKIIVGAGVRRAAAVVIQIVARPDRGVGFVKRQLVRAEFAAEQPAFPREMPLDDRPHLRGIIRVAGPEQMPEERVHGDEIHVVMIFRHVAVGMDGGLAAREIELFVGGRNGFGNRTGVLLFGKAREMRRRALVPAERVAGILPAPAEQARPPRDRAVHERLLLVIPNRVRRDVQRRRRRVDERIGRLDGHALRNRAAIFLGRGKHFGRSNLVNRRRRSPPPFARIFAHFTIDRQFRLARSQLLQRQINRLAWCKRNLPDDHGQFRPLRGGASNVSGDFHFVASATAQFCAGRRHAGDVVVLPCAA